MLGQKGDVTVRHPVELVALGSFGGRDFGEPQGNPMNLAGCIPASWIEP